jgi:hypothetical protein
MTRKSWLRSSWHSIRSTDTLAGDQVSDGFDRGWRVCDGKRC